MPYGSSISPVVVGLAVGVGLITLFAMFFTGESSLFDDQMRSDESTTILIPSATSYAGSRENFEPQSARVVIGVNNTVKWVNQDIMTAMIEADNDSDPLFYTMTKDFVTIEPNKSFEFTFTKTGEFGYHGKPWQRGTILVLPAIG